MGDAQFNGTPEEWDALVKKNKKKQTAVEWLLDNLNTEPYSEADFEHNRECWDKAEKMEKDIAVEFGYDIADYLACDVLSKKAIEDMYNEFLNSEEDGETLDTDTTL